MNWNEYKTQVKETDPIGKVLIDEAEAEAEIISAIIKQRNALGLSQRDLASLCDIPQSSVARIESSKTTPKLSTIIKICNQLGLSLNVSVN
ncbi:helix-turn-helix domain-containing protein [Butyrivibrio sp. YAB3001]|uniref:helix-turn-helix domain-containing protein n=1 Tax=Butyrivibrio sp. YAB3001 TaxID=1520812 RepID=UPI0008F64F2A|nr:helix-turn-helix transcriptional regulator [Butyrivibrio sp. YAB3001]SFC86975.1 Helix-turn-helix [Butyrivibrio sp. YAB3001]